MLSTRDTPRTGIRIAFVIAFAAACVAAAAPGQFVGPRITLQVAEWLPSWDAGGGWGVVPTGAPLGQWTAFTNSARALPVQQGIYDVYWQQRSDLPPFPIAIGLGVGAAGATVNVSTGVKLVAADWARLDGTARWAAATAGPQKTVVNESTGGAMVLPLGRYDIYWKAGVDLIFGWINEVLISPSFGSMGIEVEARPDGLRVVTPLAGGTAERAGIRAGDVITAVDGRNVVGLDLTAGVGVLRGPPATTSNLTIIRSGTSLTLTVPRAEQATITTVTIDSGIRLRLSGPLALPAELALPIDPQTGWWGAVPEAGGFDPTSPVNRSRNVSKPLPLRPGTFDVYWRQDDKTAPALLAKGVIVEAGRITEAAVRR